MPIVYNEEKVQATDSDANTSLTHFEQERDYGYYLLNCGDKFFMVSLTIGFSNHSVTNEKRKRHTFYITGFSRVNPKDLTRVFDEVIGRWVNVHNGHYVKANYKPYMDIIISHLKVLCTYGHSISEWPNEIIISFSRLDESRKMQGKIL